MQTAAIDGRKPTRRNTETDMRPAVATRDDEPSA